MVLILGDGIRFIDISTHVIAFRRDGGLRRPPIIFLHTLGGDMMQWVVSDVYKDLVGRGLEVYAVDLDGHGFSGRNPYDEEFMKIERLASSIASFVERAGVEKPVLVGISLGGSVAILARALLKERALGALALAPMVRGDPDRFSKLASLWERVSDPEEAIEIMANTLKHSTPGIEEKEIYRYLVERIAWRFHFRVDLVKTIASFYRYNQDINLAEIVGDLSNKMVTIIGCDRDPLVSQEDLERFSRSTGATLKIFRGCGHMLIYEKPGEIVDEILSIIDRGRAL
ncbi:MAG: alpha/beta hydrolase [Sulfolobales archaeon]